MATSGSNGVAPVQNEKINTDIVTLTRFLTEEQAKHLEATGDFTYVLPSPHLCNYS
jgi:fructose-1,6-bisphosphatase I